MCFSSNSLVIFPLDVRGHTGVATPGCVSSSLQRWILWRRVGTDRGPTGHVLADKGTVLGELATFINTNKKQLGAHTFRLDGRTVLSLLCY